MGTKAKPIRGYRVIQGDCHKRSKRSAEEEDLSLETFADLQVEDSYKRVIRVAIIG